MIGLKLNDFSKNEILWYLKKVPETNELLMKKSEEFPSIQKIAENLIVRNNDFLIFQKEIENCGNGNVPTNIQFLFKGIIIELTIVLGRMNNNENDLRGQRAGEELLINIPECPEELKKIL